MTIESIVKNLQSAIKEQLGFPSILLPQTAKNNTALISLQYQDIETNGSNGERLTFDAEYRTSGTHAKWLSQVISLRRKLFEIERSHMSFDVDGVKMRAYWIRRNKPAWIYPDNDDGAMPAEYTLYYEVQIDIPTRLMEV